MSWYQTVQRISYYGVAHYSGFTDVRQVRAQHSADSLVPTF